MAISPHSRSRDIILSARIMQNIHYPYIPPIIYNPPAPHQQIKKTPLLIHHPSPSPPFPFPAPTSQSNPHKPKRSTSIPTSRLNFNFNFNFNLTHISPNEPNPTQPLKLLIRLDSIPPRTVYERSMRRERSNLLSRNTTPRYLAS